MNPKGKCCVEGCDRDAHYRESRLCQKHYFRKWRTGDVMLKERRRIERRRNPAGYQLIYAPEHKLADSGGYVYEHRFIVYADYGDDLPPCSICGKEIKWGDCHIDHIDNDVSNNARENLRQTCRPCNVRRGRKPECEYPRNSKITIDGVSLTANEWSKRQGVNVTGATILRRKKLGASDFDAVYGRKRTHNRGLCEGL